MSQRLAADCLFLRRTMDSRRSDGPLVCLCTHPVRDGFDCVGPFLEETSTDCGLWESARRTAPSSSDLIRQGHGQRLPA